MDSTGLHLLLRMTAACKDADRLRVVNGSSAVVRLLDVSGVRDRLPIISSDQRSARAVSRDVSRCPVTAMSPGTIPALPVPTVSTPYS